MINLNKTPPWGDDPRWISVNVSKISIVMASTAGFGAMLVVCFLPLPTWVVAGSVLALCVGIAYEIIHLLLKRADSVLAFYLFDLDPEILSPGRQEKSTPRKVLGIRLHHRNGQQSDGRVGNGAFVMPWFISIPYLTTPAQPERISNRVLHAVWSKRWRVHSSTLPLWRDSIAPDDGRRTRIRLRWD